MAEYERAKARLFDVPSLAHAVLNLDDAFGRRLAERCLARALRTTGYRVQPGPDDTPVDVSLIGASVALGAGDIRLDARLRRAGASERTVPVQAPVLGRFNVSNVLGVLGIALAAGIDAGDAARAMQGLRPPPGRLQRVEIEAGSATADLPLVLIDYAHTPDAIEQALAALRPVAQARSGRLWIVFGAGGDRDPGKRPQMGAAAVHGADQVVVTSDNPRSEEPRRIISQILAGAGDAGTRLSHVEDRALAIGHAVALADAADVVLIAGKGHEQYQETAGRRLAFSDLECARQALQRRVDGARAGASR
jgi:UDP-N-acetylmuramyl-tripeptide synthetase